MPLWARRDELATRAARKEKRFLDRRSWIGIRRDNTLYLRLYGCDKESQYLALHLLWDGLCAKCSKPVKDNWRELDHMISLGRGGDDQDSNLQFLCRPCHRRKHNREVQLRAVADPNRIEEARKP